MRTMYNQLCHIFIFLFFVDVLRTAVVVSGSTFLHGHLPLSLAPSVNAINMILGRGPQSRADASLLYYKQ